MPKSVFTDAYASVIATLVALRKERGVSQVELARRLGKSQQFISYVERCERRIDVVEFFAIVRALGDDPLIVLGKVAAELPANLTI
jgi:transcriptional regulator with XRE-family HTH domain